MEIYSSKMNGNYPMDVTKRRERRERKVKKKGELCQEKDERVEKVWEYLEKSVWRGNEWVE